MACITRLCNVCLQQIISKPGMYGFGLFVFCVGSLSFVNCAIFCYCTVSSSVIPKRFRYYWEARQHNRDRARLMMITLPRLQPRQPDDYKKEKQEDKVPAYICKLLFNDRHLQQN